MAKSLERDGWVRYFPSWCVSDEERQKIGDEYVTQAPVAGDFLVETLGFDWDEIHAEAEELEHAISEYLRN